MLGSIVSFFAGWQVKLAVVLIVSISLYTYHKIQIKVAVNTAVAEIELQSAKERFKILDKAQAVTYALRDSNDKSIKEKDEKLKLLTTRVATLTASLQNRPERPAESSNTSRSTSNPESPQGATGASLYREDGIFLSREAAKAVELQEWLKLCYKDYDSVKEKLEKFKRDNPSKTQ